MPDMVRRVGEWAVLMAERDELAAKVVRLERELVDERAKVADLEAAARYDELVSGHTVAVVTIKPPPHKRTDMVVCTDCDREYTPNLPRCPGCGSYHRKPVE